MALCVSVNAPLNCLSHTLRAPAAMVPRSVMVVVPLTMTLFDVAAPMSVVAALAMVCVVAQLESAGHGVASLATAPVGVAPVAHHLSRQLRLLPLLVQLHLVAPVGPTEPSAPDKDATTR